LSEMITGLDPKLIYTVLAVLGVISTGAISAPYILNNDVDQSLSGETHEEKLNFRQDDATNVLNVINNMQAGYISAFDAREYILDERFYAKQYKDGNAVEAEVNVAYIAYLNAAIDVTNAYSNHGKDSQEFQEMIGIMEEKKNLI